jgi:hypothetical protein
LRRRDVSVDAGEEKFNSVARAQFLATWFAPRGEVCPEGWTLSPRGNVHPFLHSQGWTLSTNWESAKNSQSGR